MDVGEITFPHEVTCGSATVKIYKVTNKTDKDGNKRDSFTVSYSTKGKRKLKMFSVFTDAETYAESAAKKISDGELNALELSGAAALVYVSAAKEAEPSSLFGFSGVLGLQASLFACRVVDPIERPP